MTDNLAAELHRFMRLKCATRLNSLAKGLPHGTDRLLSICVSDFATLISSRHGESIMIR